MRRGPYTGRPDRGEPLASPTASRLEEFGMVRLPTLRRALVSLGVVGVLAFAAPTAFAGGNGAFTDTQNLHNATMTFHADAQCDAPAGTVTATFNAVFHVTVNKAGDVWLTGTQAGTFIFVPD